jgi:hypothetical protein
MTNVIPFFCQISFDRQHKIGVYFYRYKMTDIEFIWDREENN